MESAWDVSCGFSIGVLGHSGGRGGAGRVCKNGGRCPSQYIFQQAGFMACLSTAPQGEADVAHRKVGEPSVPNTNPDDPDVLKEDVMESQKASSE